MARGGGLGFEDEKFSYVLAMKELSTPTAARIVRPPAIHSHMIDISLCKPEGLERARITKKDKDAWKSARKADWGDRWPA
jgi:ribosomal protein RSM22 (predicted rRNA methylase)